MDKIAIDPILLTYVVQTLGRVPESLYDFHDTLPERLEIVRGDFSVIGKMSRLKKLSISAMQVSDFSFLKTCTALQSLEISACGVIDCAFLKELTNLKSLSLLHCSGLIHMEDILKLFRLERLSLEGSMVQDASCFMDCRIKEVHLPEHCLKAKQVKNVVAFKARNEKGHLCTGVPFQARERKRYSYTIQEFDSPLWDFYRGAYGNVSEYLEILTGERDEAPETFKLRRLDNALKTNYEMAFDNLCENLWHQMSFYSATWLAIPYLARLMEDWEKENDVEWLVQGIVAAGSCLATDVIGDRPGEDGVQQSYENAILQIRDMTLNFLVEHIDHVREKDIHWRREFAFAVMAILGEKELAYMFFLSGLQNCYIVCPSCENCDEEIEFGYCNPDERIEKAEVPAEKWDGRSLEDVKSWLFNLFALLDDTEGIERLRYSFGSYICSECGERIPVLTGMRGYFLS